MQHLKQLTCQGQLENRGKFSDLSPLQGLPLEELKYRPGIAFKNIRTHKKHKRLKTINGKPAAAYLENLPREIAELFP